MIQKNFINNPLFRIFGPPIYGITIYVLILLIFDSIDQLYENFFGGQVLLCIILTYLLTELMRFSIKLIERFCSKDCNTTLRLFIQFFAIGIISILITTLIISAYYNFLVGFSNFATELIVFNSIYLLTSIFYNLIYFSIFYLNRLNELKLHHENKVRTSLENELKTYKNKINPEFLFSSFESILSLVYSDKEKADDLLNTLSRIYRHILSSKKNELIHVKKEFEAANDLIKLLNFKYHNSISLKIILPDSLNYKQIIPGTVLTCIEKIIKITIISPIQPLIINIEVNEKLINLKHKKINRVTPIEEYKGEMESLNRAYSFFSDEKINIQNINSEIVYEIPALEINE